MRYDKSHLSIDDQVARLTSRGMQGDPLVMAERLSVANYHRLTAYWHPFRLSDHSFVPGTDFETVWRRYVFDRQLRLLVLDAIERFEVALRTQFSFHHSKRGRARGRAEHGVRPYLWEGVTKYAEKMRI